MKSYPNRPKSPEELYVDFDEETEMYGVFGTESGHCYKLFYDKNKAEEYVRSR